MIAIDLPAELHFEDDDGLVLARTSGAREPKGLREGTVLVAGSADAWTWAEVVSIEEGWAHLRPLTTAQAAAKANLVAPLPESA